MGLDQIFEQEVSSQRVPGVAAIALDASGNVLYRGGFGQTDINDSNAAKVTLETPFLLWSCTKLFTSVAALQLLEQEKIALEDPVEKYVPAVKDIQILEGFDDNSSPKYRAPKKQMTILHLFTHTAGFTYDFFDANTRDYRAAMKQSAATILPTGAWHEFTTPLAHEPGERYTYGVSVDWLGFVVEAVSGMRLEEYIDRNILQPLGLHNSGANLKPGQEEKFMVCHMKDRQGKLTPNKDIRSPEKPDKFGGGHYLISTADDFARFLLVILNYGKDPKTGTTILESETVKKYIFTDQMPLTGCSYDGIGDVAGSIAQISRDGKFLPHVKKGWSLGLMTNATDLAHGRKAGSGGWAGLGNNYYWIDPVSGKLGVVLSAILPFFDPAVLHLFDALEREVYGHSAAKSAGEIGSNFATKMSM